MKTKLPCGCAVDLRDEVDMLNHLARHAPPPPDTVRILQDLGFKYDGNTNTFTQTFTQPKGNTKS